jgi:CheY-like chemotaxis protein
MSQTILIIDDERIMRDGLTYMLTKSGYQICATPNGPLGLERFG